MAGWVFPWTGPVHANFVPTIELAYTETILLSDSYGYCWTTHGVIDIGTFRIRQELSSVHHDGTLTNMRTAQFE